MTKDKIGFEALATGDMTCIPSVSARDDGNTQLLSNHLEPGRRYRVTVERVRVDLPDNWEWQGDAIVFDQKGYPRTWVVLGTSQWGADIKATNADWTPAFIIDAFRAEGLLPPAEEE